MSPSSGEFVESEFVCAATGESFRHVNSEGVDRSCQCSDGSLSLAFSVDTGCTFDFDNGTRLEFANGESFGELSYAAECGTDYPCFCDVSLDDFQSCPYCAFETIDGSYACGTTGDIIRFADQAGVNQVCQCTDGSLGQFLCAVDDASPTPATPVSTMSPVNITDTAQPTPAVTSPPTPSPMNPVGTFQPTPADTTPPTESPVNPLDSTKWEPAAGSFSCDQAGKECIITACGGCTVVAVGWTKRELNEFDVFKLTDASDSSLVVTNAGDGTSITCITGCICEPVDGTEESCTLATDDTSAGAIQRSVGKEWVATLVIAAFLFF